MSAFLVSDSHIHAIVSFAENIGEIYYSGESLPLKGDFYSSENRDKVGQILLDANYKSVNCRYRGKGYYPEKPHKYSFKRVHAVNPVQIIKLCHCLEYQSCEFSGWESSTAKAILNNVIDNACRKLPGYSEAKWDLS